jgi:hypothetical protein
VLQSYQDDPSWARSTQLKQLSTQLPDIIAKLRSQAHSVLQKRVQTDTLKDDERPAIPYDLALTAFFDMMLDKQLGPNDPRQCVECLADDTIIDDQKWWPDAVKLRQHLSGMVHSPVQRWRRKVEIAKRESEDQSYHCYPECGKKWKKVDALTKHLEAEKTKIDDEPTDLAPSTNIHFSGMQADGWFSANFKANRKTASQQRTKEKNKPAMRGTRTKLVELPKPRAGLIHGVASPFLTVGPEDQHANAGQLLQYPAGFSATGIAQYGGEPVQPSLAETLRDRGVPSQWFFPGAQHEKPEGWAKTFEQENPMMSSADQGQRDLRKF